MLLYEKKPLSARFPLISIYLAIIGRKLVICLKVVTIYDSENVFFLEKQQVIITKVQKMVLTLDRVMILYA